MSARAAAVPLLLALGLGGCAGDQSMLAPAGLEARQVFHLSMVLFIGAGVILAWVLGTLALALAGPPAVRRAIASRTAVLWAGLAVPLVVLTALLVAGLMMMRERAGAAPDGPRIEVVGEQWWWRVTYVTADGRRIAGANEIRIPTGRTVTFVLDAADVIHAFWIPALGGKRDMIPGRTNILHVKAERDGIYRGQCAEYCGGAHAVMALEVIALPEPAFEAWLETAAAPAPEPATPLAQRGAAAFEAAGCGACHAVAGTAAAGTIGPDLTRFGERRTLGAAMRPNTTENLVRFIADAPAHKPGTAMPAFAMLDAEELDAMAAYLSALR